MKFALFCAWCDKPMFLTDKIPEPGAIADSRDFRELDGSPLRLRSDRAVVCPSCLKFQPGQVPASMVRPHGD